MGYFREEYRVFKLMAGSKLGRIEGISACVGCRDYSDGNYCVIVI